MSGPSLSLVVGRMDTGATRPLCTLYTPALLSSAMPMEHRLSGYMDPPSGICLMGAVLVLVLLLWGHSGDCEVLWLAFLARASFFGPKYLLAFFKLFLKADTNVFSDPRCDR